MKYQNSFLIVMVAVAVISLRASNVQPQPIYNNKETSLEKCVKHLDTLQAYLGLNTLRSRKVSTIGDCIDTIETILRHTPPHHRSQMLFGPKSDDAYRLSNEYRTPDVDGSNSHNDRNIRNNAAFPGPNGALYSKYISPKINKNFSGKLAATRNTLPKELVSHDFESNLPGNLRSTDVYQISLKPGESLLSRLTYLPNKSKSKTYSNDIDINEKLDDVQKDDVVPDDEVYWTDMASSAKRGSDNWLNVVNTEVGKRHRQTLSINNALMALTDMVMEHGREKQMRNRDNLRYHMFIQG